jgi:hypothetical protein
VTSGVFNSTLKNSPDLENSELIIHWRKCRFLHRHTSIELISVPRMQKGLCRLCSSCKVGLLRSAYNSVLLLYSKGVFIFQANPRAESPISWLCQKSLLGLLQLPRLVFGDFGMDSGPSVGNGLLPGRTVLPGRSPFLDLRLSVYAKALQSRP